jgi:hypothetical protein
MADPTPTFRITPVDRGFRFEFDVVAQPEERQRKKATFGQFEILCDESAQIGGDDTAPPPLAYFGAAVAF